jgi:hypothetical protein
MKNDGVYHCIERKEHLPIRQIPRPILAKQTDVGEMLEEKERSEVIEESGSPWLCSEVLVRKNGDLRFYVNYRELYNVTKKDCIPLPWIDRTLDKLV